MKKFLFRYMLAVLFVLSFVNGLNQYIHGEEYRITSLFSPFSFQEKVRDDIRFSLDVVEMGIYKLRQKL